RQPPHKGGRDYAAYELWSWFASCNRRMALGSTVDSFAEPCGAPLPPSCTDGPGAGPDLHTSICRTADQCLAPSARPECAELAHSTRGRHGPPDSRFARHYLGEVSFGGSVAGCNVRQTPGAARPAAPAGEKDQDLLRTLLAHQLRSRGKRDSRKPRWAGRIDNGCEGHCHGLVRREPRSARSAAD